MDREDQRHYLVVGSAIVEVVTPLFQQHLENDYKTKGLRTLQEFINSQPVRHILFHLCHRHKWCCLDRPNCVNNDSLPINYSQWGLLYTKGPSLCGKTCHCNYTANSVGLEDLDITLAGLILLECCTLTPAHRQAILTLQQYKNDYLSHNNKGRITKDEYDDLWKDLKILIQQLDPSKHDDLIRIENRPMDEKLCNKYTLLLVDIHQTLEEMGISIQEMNDLIKRNNDLTELVKAVTQNNNELLQELINYARSGLCKNCRLEIDLQDQQSKPYKLGQSIFYLHHQTDLSTVLSNGMVKYISDGVMMDDGRLVLCQPYSRRLLVCNTDMSEIDSIQVQDKPWHVTVVNNSTVAVTVCLGKCIVMYDINNKHKLNQIEVPGMFYYGITTINNKLVVGGRYCLYIIDHQTEEIQTIHTGDCTPKYLYTSGDRIFYSGTECNDTMNLYCYHYSKDKATKKTLPAYLWKITSLRDGSLYVLCDDGSVQHVSSDGKHYKQVTTEGLKSLEGCTMINYNQKQRTLVTYSNSTLTANIYKEK